MKRTPGAKAKEAPVSRPQKSSGAEVDGEAPSGEEAVAEPEGSPYRGIAQGRVGSLHGHLIQHLRD